LYIIDDPCAAGKISDFGKVLNVNISFIRGRICRGKAAMFSIVGIELESNISPYRIATSRREATSQRVSLSGFSFSPGPAILQANLSVLKISKYTIAISKIVNMDKNKMTRRVEVFCVKDVSILR
jgi:hypothetical protein